MKGFFFCLLFACTIIGACVGLDCYSCVGSENSDCADPFDSSSANTETCSNGSVCIVLANYDRGQFIRTCNPREGGNSPGCVTNAGAAGEKGVCSYSCEGDLCNNRSIADGVADILHCYLCTYRSDSTAWSPTCLDPKNGSVATLPCDGVCGVTTLSIRGAEIITRQCFSDAGGTGACVPGCDVTGQCTTCCSDNLCNGELGAPSTTPTSQATSIKINLAVLSTCLLYLTLR
ncbi:uncharacterized protein LOC119725540 [Patiria miniata]|uniref:DUF753 domain-containing protein n=1 Tax=Patiria miniata TaxID=46514 RepID=A0A913ZNE9_PATMI|nr:uncharacterized protein LOC119725540 [Patiria miniata]